MSKTAAPTVVWFEANNPDLPAYMTDDRTALYLNTEFGTFRVRELANAMNWLDHCGCWIANPWQCPVCNEHAVILDTGFAATCDECGARFTRRSLYSKEWERENPSI